MKCRLFFSTAALLVPSTPAAADPPPQDTPVQLEGVAGFTAVRDWSVTNDGKTIVVTAPEGDLTVTLIDVGPA